jgi:meso-butanediol dehydrogenase/(S,S)-butanediol dehydrogenase/diacetyl reductase
LADLFSPEKEKIGMATGRFAGKIAIVTGAASGIGAAIARLLVDEQAQVLAVDIDAEALVHSGPGITNFVCDMTSSTQVDAMIAEAVSRFGRIDLLFNNAGTGALAETPDLDNETWNRVFAINVGAVLYACRAAIPHMRKQGGGAIVNTASISGLFADYGFAAYNASKGAVINYTRSLAIDHARDNIRVNAFCPGFIVGTRLTAGLESTPIRPLWDQSIPMGRGGTSEEMAKVAAFLASEEASYVTGAILVADGGLTAHTGQPNLMAMMRGQS